MPTRPPVQFRITLPLPPSVNNQYVSVGNRRMLSKNAVAFKKDVAKLVERARLDDHLTPSMEETFREAFLGVYLTFFFETPRRRDLDGGLKIALDALCGAIRADDRAVVDLHLTKQIDPLHPRLEVELEAIPAWTFDRSYVWVGDDAEAEDAPRTMEPSAADAAEADPPEELNP